MMLCALVLSAVVVEIKDLTEDQYQSAIFDYDAIIDVSNTIPAPQVGWTLSGNTLSGTIATMRITKLAMLQRFTVPERIGLLNYIQTNPASVPAMLMQNINVATFVDLMRPDTQAGIYYLVNFGLLTTARATSILNAIPTSLEVFHE
jgi:hypothetical protein